MLNYPQQRVLQYFTRNNELAKQHRVRLGFGWFGGPGNQVAAETRARVSEEANNCAISCHSNSRVEQKLTVLGRKSAWEILMLLVLGSLIMQLRCEWSMFNNPHWWKCVVLVTVSC